MKMRTISDALRRALRLSAKFTRAHVRLSCSAVGEVLFVERGCTIRGVVDEVSRGGIRLRPASSYILHRMGENVAVRVSFGRFDLAATLVNTSPQGYGFKLSQMLQQEELDEIVTTA